MARDIEVWEMIGCRAAWSVLNGTRDGSGAEGPGYPSLRNAEDDAEGIWKLENSSR
jgi:hypothetical protein